MNSVLLSLAAGGGGGGGQSSYLILMVVMLGAMYFLMLRPQKKRQKAEQEMRSTVEIGDEVITIGGINGRVVTVKDDSLVIETGADKTKMKIERWAINTNKTKTEQRQKELDAAREAKKNSKKDK